MQRKGPWVPYCRWLPGCIIRVVLLSRRSAAAEYESESPVSGANTRLRWGFSPFGARFVVYNHNLSDPGDPALERWSARRLRFASNQLLIKARYRVRY